MSNGAVVALIHHRRSNTHRQQQVNRRYGRYRHIPAIEERQAIVFSAFGIDDKSGAPHRVLVVVQNSHYSADNMLIGPTQLGIFLMGIAFMLVAFSPAF